MGEDNPELPDDRFERSSALIAAHGRNAFRPLIALLADADPHRRATAAYLLGRLAEGNYSLRIDVRQQLLDAIPAENKDEVVDALAVGASLAGLDQDEALALLRSPTANLRRVAAHHLAMVVRSDEEDESIRGALQFAGVSDPDEEVRGWAKFGLDTAGRAGARAALPTGSNGA